MSAGDKSWLANIFGFVGVSFDVNGNRKTNTAGEDAANVMAEITKSVYGSYPARDYLEGGATGSAAGTITTLTGITLYNQFTLSISALTATSVDVYVSVDGTNFVAARMTDVSTKAVTASSPLTATGIYELTGKYKAIRLDQVGAGGATLQFINGNI